MKPHLVLDDDARETAALHGLGLLDPADAAGYESHLTDCAPCRAEVQSVREALAELALAAPPTSPPPSLRSRLFDQLRAASADRRAEASRGALRSVRREPPRRETDPPPVQTWKTWPAAGDAREFSFALESEAVWEPTGVAGVEARRLFVDAANDRATMLVRMAPGTSYPRHRHAGPEECFVVDGDLLVGEIRMKAGDYQRADGGSTHDVQATRNGCVLLIVSSLGDELLPHDAA